MSSPAAVPRPANAGSGVNAIAVTNSAFINIRNGPGTQYRDIGDLRDNSLVVYYPRSRTPDNWFWMEQRGLGGWVSGGVVTFEPAVGTTAPSSTPTPYDGKVAVWYWKGENIPERSIEEFVANLKRRAPNVTQVWVKTSDGVSWQGNFDNSPLAIKSAAEVQRWVNILQQNGLEFHAWCVPQGLNVEAEASVIAATCRVPGVRSMILDVEPYAGFWQGGREAVRPFMLRLRQAVGGRFHIAMSMDPRPHHYASIFPEEWFPFVNSLHPQCYWQTFREAPEETLAEMFEAWGRFGRPIIPAFQGDAALVDQTTAHTLATQRYGFKGLSWWRYGVIAQWAGVNTPINLTTSPAQPVPAPTDNFADEMLVTPGGRGFRSGSYTGRNEFQQFDGTWNWKVFYKKTEVATSLVWAEWRVDLPESGRYEIAVFVPARHATTRKARYKIHGIRGTTTEVVVEVDQSRNRNVWVPLGIFDLVKGAPNAGRVFLNDVTGEPDQSIAFDAVRFRRIVSITPAPGGSGGTTTNPPRGSRPSVVNGVPVADGYDSPIGTTTQRAASQVWPPGWLDASPFGRLYFVGTPSEAYHTGADLNFGRPYEDKGMPVFAPANGVVTFAGVLRIWGNVIVIRHDPLYDPGGVVLYTRLGHVQNLRVQPGDRVKRGDQICEIGDAFGRFIPHLHFDLSPTTILERQPSHWPGTDQADLLKNYIDPLTFIRRNRP
ncbi:MAG: peptidoglycan DD-metalloendopeptidase family protein [Anaerolineae bacterium]|nr:peptidoglycan DD-metalloendopeptidase family protein [Anaerolineae bacterium]